MDLAKIGHLGPPPEFFGRKLMNRRENGRHRHVHPDVDRAELALHPIGCGVYRFGIRNVGRDRDRPAAESFQFNNRALKPLRVPRQQRTSQPLRANSVATARPTPAPAPVITAIFRISNPQIEAYGNHRLLRPAYTSPKLFCSPGRAKQ